MSNITSMYIINTTLHYYFGSKHSVFFKMYPKWGFQGYSAKVECLPSRPEALCSIPSPENKAVLNRLSSPLCPVCIGRISAVRRTSPAPCRSSMLRRIILAFLFPTVFSLKLVSKSYFDALRILGSEFWSLAALEKLPLCFLDQAAAKEVSATTLVLVLVSRSFLSSSAHCCDNLDCLLLSLMGEGLTAILFGENCHYFLKTYLPSLSQLSFFRDSCPV